MIADLPTRNQAKNVRSGTFLIGREGPGQRRAWKKLANVVSTMAAVATITNQKTTGRRLRSGGSSELTAAGGAPAAVVRPDSR